MKEDIRRVHVLCEDTETEDGRIFTDIKGIYDSEDKIRAALKVFQEANQDKSITYSLYRYKLQ